MGGDWRGFSRFFVPCWGRRFTDEVPDVYVVDAGVGEVLVSVFFSRVAVGSPSREAFRRVWRVVPAEYDESPGVDLDDAGWWRSSGRFENLTPAAAAAVARVVPGAPGVAAVL